MARKMILMSFIEEEKSRLNKIEKLIPHYHMITRDQRDEEGISMLYFKTFIPGVSLSHALLSYNFNDLFKFDCLSVDKSEHPNPSRDIKDNKDPQSMFFWFW